LKIHGRFFAVKFVLAFIDNLALFKIVHKLQVFWGKKRHELKGWNVGKMIENKGFCVHRPINMPDKNGPPRGCRKALIDLYSP